jgi:hypothetical protein
VSLFVQSGSDGPVGSAAVARHDREQVIAEVAEWDGAEPIRVAAAFDALIGAGLSVARAREWLVHKDRHHPVPVWSETFGFTLGYRPAHALNLAPDAALAEIDAYVRADPSARDLADDLWLTMAAVDRLTGGSDERREAISEACRLMKRQVPKRGRLADVVRTRHQHYNDRAILDVLADGREAEVIDDLRNDRLNVTDERQLGVWIGGATDFDDR